jgi:hypothetical protein
VVNVNEAAAGCEDELVKVLLTVRAFSPVPVRLRGRIGQGIANSSCI